MKIKLTAAVIIAMSLYCVSSGVVPSPIIPTQINYQGVLKNSAGSMITNPSLPVVFSIYSAAGTALWTETQTVSVDAGVYSVQLGSVTLIPIDGSVFDGNTRYLGIKVGSDAEMTPRVALVSVPYAYKAATANFATSATTAQTANALTSGAGLTTGMITAEILGADDNVAAILGHITSASPGQYSTGIEGIGGYYGVHGSGSTGVFGQATTDGLGVYGLSTDGRGVYGQSTNSGYGVYGASSNNIGVYGTGPIAGGSFETTGTEGIGVYGKATDASNTANGGVFEGFGQFCYGVTGKTNGTSGIGVFGRASSSSGSNYGVYGRTDSTAGTGVFGSVNAGSGVNYGVYGQTSSSSGYGVYGNASSGVGVYGNSNSNTGVYGNSTSAQGVYGNTDSGAGVVGNSGATGYAGWFTGGMGVKIPTVSGFPGTSPADGTMILDNSTGSGVLYIRAKGAWKTITL